MPHNSEPSENWDDDFEFHSNRTSRRSPIQDQQDLFLQDPHDDDPHRPLPRPRTSHDTATTTENWDDDFAEDDNDDEVPAPSSSSIHPNSNLNSQENSNDAHTRASTSTSTSTSTSGFDLPPPPAPSKSRHNRTPRASRTQRHRPGLNSGGGSDATQRKVSPAATITPSPRMRSASGATVNSNSTASASGSGWSSDDDEDGEMGFAAGGGPDEDRTVTARSASGASSRRALSYNLGGSPPPPVPPLPSGAHNGGGLVLSIPTGPMGSASGGLGMMQPQPFPRSPTASVFSAPDNASIAYTHTSAGSTTALNRPHKLNRNREKEGWEGARGLAGLPPSPPIHRERRRLRKKSRPSGAGGGGGASGVVEMREMKMARGVGGRERESSEDAQEEEEEDWDAEDPGLGGGSGIAGGVYGSAAGGGEAGASRSRSSVVVSFAPTPDANANNNTPYGAQGAAAGGSHSHVTLGSPGLLARIGSVKRWGFGVGGKGHGEGDERGGVLGRRKKGSSISVASEGMGYGDLDVIPDITAHANGHNDATPRPPSASSLMRTGSQSSSRSRHSYAHPPPATPPPRSAAVRYSQHTPRTPEATPPQQDSRGWFFRAPSGSPAERGRFRGSGTGGTGNGNGGGGGGVGRDGAAAEGGADVNPERSYTPTPHGAGEKEAKTKLVKRRSLGFVQIRRGIRPLNGNAEGGEQATPTAENANPTPGASPSKGYAGLGVGRPSGAAVGSVEDLGRQKEKEREGMGFVERNVRRISLVGAGRHKRTKSGVSVTGLGLSGDEKENDGKGKKGSARPVVEGLPPAPPVDVQLHPPSPPQTLRATSGSMATVKASAPISIASPNNLDVRPMAFSPTFSVASSAASLSSPISLASSSSPSLTPYSAASASPPSNSPSPKPPVSPQSASLGRAAANNPAVSAAVASPVGAAGSGTMRRNSLGDLKIPARISQAQVGLRRDLGMVREFARLKELQGTYQSLVSEVQEILDLHVLQTSQLKEKEKDPSRVASPTFFKRHRSNTSSSNPGAPSPAMQQQQAYKQLASAFYTINSKYRISWECAELLIELGGGGSAATPPSTSTSAPAMQSVGGSDGLRSGKNKARERAITLQDDAKVPPSPGPLTSAASVGAIPGPPLASPPSNLAWRASTGRNDLSQRQLLLLKEMLGSPVPGGPDDSFAEDGIPEEVVAAAAASTNTVNREWRWGDAMNSTVTLPSEESGVQGGMPGKEKKRRSSRLRMSGIREMLRSLTKGGVHPPVPASSTSVSTESSGDLHAQHLYEHRQVPTNGRRRRAKTSAGPESIRSDRRPLSPFDPSSLKTASPRRPSLASIFRLGKTKTPPPSSAADASFGSAHDGGDRDRDRDRDRELYPTFSGISGGRESASNSTGDEEEDWDRMEDSASDVEAATAALARRGGSTIRGRSPYSHSSFLAPLPGRPTTPIRSPSGSRTSIHDPSGAGPARATRLSNVEEHVGGRSTSKAESPPRQFSRSRRGGKTGSVRSMPPATLPDPKLAMTPENIKPLLENAREVHVRLSDCIAEIRSLLVARP